MAYHNIENNLPSENGIYIIQILTLKGYIREAKAIWEKQQGFNLVALALKPGESIKSWWQY